MTHVAAYFDGRGGKKQHPGTVWDCPKRRCMEWTALWRDDLHAAIDRTDRRVIHSIDTGEGLIRRWVGGPTLFWFKAAPVGRGQT